MRKGEAMPEGLKRYRVAYENGQSFVVDAPGEGSAICKADEMLSRLYTMDDSPEVAEVTRLPRTPEEVSE